MISKNTFSTEHHQTAASAFLQKNIDKFKECQTNKRTKKIHIWRKKAKHGAEGNELQCQLLLTQGLAATDKGYGHWLFLQGSSITDVW